MTMESIENKIGCPFNNRCYLYGKKLCQNYYSYRICSEFPSKYAKYKKKRLASYFKYPQLGLNLEYFNIIQNFKDFLNFQYYKSSSFVERQLIQNKIDIYENLLRLKIYLKEGL